MEAQLARRDFDSQKFIHSFWKPGSDDVRKLRELRSQIQVLADESMHVVKKSVCQNYAQFIKTAKEISHLETEVYQLSHLLGEQRSLIEAMMEISPSGVKYKTDSSITTTANVNAVQHALEKIENCCHLPENPNRELIFESDLKELNFESYAVMRDMHAFLFSDGFLLTENTAGYLFRYKFDSLYQLENLALINVKETSALASPNSINNNVLKLLVFPEHKLLQCENARIKKRWIDAVENAKKRMIREGSLMRQATIRQKKGAAAGGDHSAIKSLSQQSMAKIDEKAPISEEQMQAELEYLRELPDELDACIIQRDFDNAIDILQDGRESLKDWPDGATANEIRERLNAKEGQLINVLCKECKVSGGGMVGSSGGHHTSSTGDSRHAPQKGGGPKAARKAVALLNRLGKFSLACDLYLKNRSAYVKNEIRELATIDNPIDYVYEITRLFSKTFLDVGKEFLRHFHQHASCFSVFSLWAAGELKHCVTLVLNHVIDSASGLSILGQCVQLAYESLDSLVDVGLDLTFELDALLEAHILKAVEENGRNFIETLNLRIMEDKWKPYNLQSEANLSNFLIEMREFGLDLEKYAFNRCFLWLTNQVCHFLRNIIPFSRELAALRFGNHAKACDQVLLDIWTVEFDHFVNCRSKCGDEMYRKNCTFLVNYLMPLSLTKFKKDASKKIWQLLTDLLLKRYPMLLEHVSDRRDDKFDNFETVGEV